MKASFERHLTILSSAIVACVLMATVLASAAMALVFYVHGMMHDLQNTAAEVVGVLETTRPAPADAIAAGHDVAQRLFGPPLQIIVFDKTRRVDVRQISTNHSRYAIVTVSGRNDLPIERRQGVATRAALALATLFGLRGVPVHVGGLLVLVHVDESETAAMVAREIPLLGFALACACALGIACGRILAVQALQPVKHVTAALEHFAAGDLVPRAVPERGGEQLSALARAYNDAAAAVHRAFAERERAQAGMRQFITDAGHELRTPLTVIRGFITILQGGDLRAAADRERILATMRQQAALMGSLIDNLILLDRWEDPHDGRVADPVDVSQLVEDIVTPIADANPEREVRLAIVPGLLVYIDPIDLAHAVTNLVDNALKYAPGKPVDVQIDADDAFVAISVTDSGPGMSTDEQSHAFDRFYRGPHQRDVPGSGLGLAIAQRAVERASGRLTLDTAPGRGARLTIVLPLVGERALPVRSAPAGWETAASVRA